MDARLKTRFKKHLLETVGKEPGKKEMTLVFRKLKEEYSMLYGKPNKPLPVIRKSFNSLSAIWPTLVAGTSSFSEITLLTKYAKISRNLNITSIASGLCVFELFLAKEFVPNGKIFCLDLSEEMNKRAKALKRKLKQKNINIVTASATKIPVKSNSQDIVLARRTGLSNDKRWTAVLKEAYRILKKNPSSRFIYTVATDFNKPVKNIKKDMDRAGLEFIAIEKFGVKEKRPAFMIIACVKNIQQLL